MTTRRVAFVFLVVVSVVGHAIGTAHAWGEKGHRITGYIAMQLLTPSSRSEITALMGSANLSTITLYMDQHKEQLKHQIPGSDQWHFDDIPVCGTATPAQFCPDDRCASAQIPVHRAILRNTGASRTQRTFAVYVLSHVIGDIHQPLHSADDHDRGGNNVFVILPGDRQSTKLHAAWDTTFLERQFGNKSELAVAKDLIKKYRGQAVAWRRGEPEDWISETHQVAAQMAYGQLPGFQCGVAVPSAIRLPVGYVDAAEIVAEQQLARAGYRLAEILNRELGQ